MTHFDDDDDDFGKKIVKRGIKSTKRRKSRSKKSSKCKNRLRKKIAINMKELKKKRSLFKNPAQAIAVSYSQVLKKHPACKKSLRRK